MFETNIAIVGNVLTTPEWRRTSTSNQLVTHFRVASTARRFDRETGRWVDGNSMRVRVTAWRRLAEGVASSIAIGDPVIVYGRIYTRDWVDDDNRNRVSYEVEAFSIGHDLGRGRGRFFRNRAGAATAEEPETDTMVRGEPSTAVDEAEQPVAFGDGMPDRVPGEGEPSFLEVVAGLTAGAVDEPPHVGAVDEAPRAGAVDEGTRAAAIGGAPHAGAVGEVPQSDRREPVPA
ncbi:single-stranded DNA-binding protein [Actinoplanes rectilineatus]|uniref:single-stranded DNA-binding protein n=1 Tax=Actinoplanes rectilineatus TaxID=113571 RepID=UPI0009F98EE5|nr:single-stranded DNA-binding protein [Actinoplanes rectilineatus]